MASQAFFYILAIIWGALKALQRFQIDGDLAVAGIVFISAAVVGGLFSLLIGWIWRYFTKKPHHLYLAANWFLLVGILLNIVVQMNNITPMGG